MASVKGTLSFSKKNKDIKYKKLGKTGFTASICGFGCYRIDYGVIEHKLSLEYAIKNGINIIDTSSNYSNGGSEKLVGSVLENLIEQKVIRPDEIILITKGGYLQGDNLKKAIEREKAKSPFPEMIKCSPDMWHCIHPEFLRHQISQSLKYLKTSKIDIYLLHNPEYFLTYWQPEESVKKNEEYYKRLKNAFIYLEEEVKTGRIGFYGISSNSFGDSGDKNNFTSAEELLRIANEISHENHFAVVQLPVNILEKGGVVNKNQAGGNKTFLEVAEENELGVLVNRPLNSIINNRIRRLSDFAVKEERTKEETLDLLKNLDRQEDILKIDFVESLKVGASEKRTLNECLSLSQMLSENYDKFESPNHFKEIKEYYLIPRANYAISLLISKYQQDEELITRIKNFAFTLNIALDSVESDLAKNYNEKNKKNHSLLNKYLSPEQRKLTLSQKSILFINSLKSVTATLIGMRTIDYVKDVLGSVKSSYILNVEEFWEKENLQ